MTKMNGYEAIISRRWNHPTDARPMLFLWNKLKRLQPMLRTLSKPIAHVQQSIAKAISDLEQAQTNLIHDRMNIHLIEKVNNCTKEIIRWNGIE